MLDVCRDLRVEATLLKGLSVSDRLYPAGHLRPMGDLDILVPTGDEAKVAEELLARGFERLPYPETPGQNHGAPLRHARRRTFLELHIALFPESAPVHPRFVRALSIFALHGGISDHIYGTDAGHLSPRSSSPTSQLHELQRHDKVPIWTRASWHLFGTVLLLKVDGPALDWDALLRSVDNDMVKSSLYALLTYVIRFGTTPPPEQVLRRLARNRGLVGPLQRRLIHAALDRYLLGARVWSLPFPRRCRVGTARPINSGSASRGGDESGLEQPYSRTEPECLRRLGAGGWDGRRRGRRFCRGRQAECRPRIDRLRRRSHRLRHCCLRGNSCGQLRSGMRCGHRTLRDRRAHILMIRGVGRLGFACRCDKVRTGGRTWSGRVARIGPVVGEPGED